MNLMTDPTVVAASAQAGDLNLSFEQWLFLYPYNLTQLPQLFLLKRLKNDLIHVLN